MRFRRRQAADRAAIDRTASRRCAAAAGGGLVRAGRPLDRRETASSGALDWVVTPGHIVMIPSWYRSARGSGGGYFRDRALALQRAGWRVAMLAPDLYTPRDLRRGEVASGRGPRIRVEDDGVETWRGAKLCRFPARPTPQPALFGQ